MKKQEGYSVPKKPTGIVLLSGGMDSCVVTAIASRENNLALLHVNYGHRTEQRELRAFHEIADFYGSSSRLIADLSYLKEIGGSSLTDKTIDIPVASGHEGKRHRIPSTYVPFRNAHILSVAVSWGEVIGAKNIYVGAVEEDSSGYPDCRESFYKIFEMAITEGTRPDTSLKIIAPLIHMKKSAIVELGVSLGAPLHLTWSCYRGSDIGCGACDSCMLRLKGFKDAGVKDPVQYRKEIPT